MNLHWTIIGLLKIISSLNVFGDGIILLLLCFGLYPSFVILKSFKKS
jgi:hypothetical protein